MNQDQELNDDLQRAIDSVTSAANEPVTVPEVPQPEISEFGGLQQEPEPGTQQLEVPELQQETPTPQQETLPETQQQEVEPAPMPDFSNSFASVPEEATASAMLDFNAPEPMAEPKFGAVEDDVFASGRGLTEDMQKVREAALRDLAPLLGEINVNPAQKFRLYHDILTTIGDRSVIEPAYQAAKNISDDKERGKALLFLIEAIG